LTGQGAAPELKYGGAVIVNSLSDVKKIPTSFDFDQLVEAHRFAFSDSSVHVHRFINVVYLIYSYSDLVASSTSAGTGSGDSDQRRRQKTGLKKKKQHQ
jgi:hypothetical protein